MTKEQLDHLETLLKQATQGKWKYDKTQPEHAYVIRIEGSEADNDYHSTGTDGGIIGCSEWIWIEDKDGELIVAAVNNLQELINIAREALNAR